MSLFHLFEFYKFNNIQWIKKRIEKELEFQKEIKYFLAKYDKTYLLSNKGHKNLYDFLFYLIRKGYTDICFRLKNKNKVDIMVGKILEFSSANGLFLRARESKPKCFVWGSKLLPQTKLRKKTHSQTHKM